MASWPHAGDIGVSLSPIDCGAACQIVCSLPTAFYNEVFGKLTAENVLPSYPTVGVRWGPGCLNVPYKIWTSQCKEPFV